MIFLYQSKMNLNVTEDYIILFCLKNFIQPTVYLLLLLMQFMFIACYLVRNAFFLFLIARLYAPVRMSLPFVFSRPLLLLNVTYLTLHFSFKFMNSDIFYNFKFSNVNGGCQANRILVQLSGSCDMTQISSEQLYDNLSDALLAVTHFNTLQLHFADVP